MDREHEIGIGTMVRAEGAADYIRQILPHGFESFAITFGHAVQQDIDLPEMAAQVNEVLRDSGAVVSAVGIYGNPLEEEPEDLDTRRGWEELIAGAHLFKTDLVTGFTGRLRGKPVDRSLDKFRQVFAPLASAAREKGVRLAFENCDMGGDWHSGDWNIAHGPDAWELIFQALPDDNVGLEWEPCHQMVKLIDPLPQLSRWVKKIFHLHGKCATVRHDIIREFGIKGSRPFAWHRHPGFGDADWTGIISELRRGGFRGFIDIEGWHDPVYRGELEMTGQVHALNYLKRCRGGDFVPNPR